MSTGSNAEFPFSSLQPKKETGISGYLNKYPEHDGRGVKIAIFDSGVDPGAPGLQVTSHGLPKIIEMYDATGSGDVDTSTIVTVENGEITGLSGRKLKIPTEWNNPSGNYHVGIIDILKLYPTNRDSLKKRVQDSLKEKHWNGPHNMAEADVARLIKKFEKDHPNTTELSPELKLEKEELDARVEMLKANEKLLDIGIGYDCVVFYDGNMWRAVIDNSEKGDLENCTLLGPYSETLKYGTLLQEDSYNYTVNIYEEGNVLQIVGLSSSHGTHVASIAAANFPGEPHRNGVAPGAQIVNIKIGDNRLQGMETGAAITRAAIKVIELKCDLINMSYGERSSWLGGLVLERINEIVHNNGIIFVSSAGNSGPALTTIGTPAIMDHSAIISVGAYVSPEMMVANYSVREKLPGLNYTWSSRGPTMAGNIGVTVTAPGCATTSVPNYTLENAAMYNGTSMSSPHVAGAVALLLSGLKAKGKKYSPYSIKRGLKTTALKVPSYEVFSMGSGLLQVEKAFDWLVESEDFPERDLDIDITCTDNTKGIYLREGYQLIKPTVHGVKIQPVFLRENETEATKKINLNLSLNLACDASWVSAPAHLSLQYSERMISIKVDPTGLPHGAHYTSVRAYDCKNPEKGPIFEIPITVIQPQRIRDTIRNELHMNDLLIKSGEIFRQFFEVPIGASWATVNIISKDPLNSAMFVLRGFQLVPQSNIDKTHFTKMFTLDALGETTLGIPIVPSRTLEITIAKWWNSAGDLPINVTITFRGLTPSEPEIVLQPSCGIHRLDVTSVLKLEEIHPSASLKSHVVVLRPTDSKIVPLGNRDILPKIQQIYELQLTYLLNITKAAEVTPSFSYLSDFLYESEYDSQLWMLFDSNKRLLLTGDAFPFAYAYSTKLEKGDYTIKLQVRHEKKSMLEKLTESFMEVTFKLTTPIVLDIYYTCVAALTEGKKVGAKKVGYGETVPLYITPLANDKLPKCGIPGQYLLGTISYSKDETGKKVSTYPIKYMIPEAPKKPVVPKSTDKTKTPEEEYSEALRDLKVTWIPKLTGQASDDLYKDAISQHAQNVQTIIARVQFLDSNKERPVESLREIIKLCDEVLSIIDPKELLAFFATKNGKKQDPNLFKSQEKNKSAVIEAITKKGTAMCDLFESPTNTESTDSKSETSDSPKPVTLVEIDEVFSELQKWADTYDVKVTQFTEKHAKAHKHYGRALKSMSKQLEDKPSMELDKSCIELYEKLGWNYCIKWATNALSVKYPTDYALF